MMCLGKVFYGDRKRAELAKLPNMVTCYKVVTHRANQYGSQYFPQIFRENPFLAGWNETKPISIGNGYWIAFHAFLAKKGASRWTRYSRGTTIIRCKTAKKDIVAIGKQDGHFCLVTKRIWIPKPRRLMAEA